MSKYLDDLKEQLKGKNIMEFTKQKQAEKNLTKVVMKQNQEERIKKINKEVERMVFG